MEDNWGVEMLDEFVDGFGLLIGYYGIFASLLIWVRYRFVVPRELFRKLLHMVCVLSIFVLLHGFDTWYLAVVAAIVFAVAIFPIIFYLERYPKIMDIFIERKPGEVKLSLVIVFFMMAILITLFWGWMGEEWKFVIIIAILAWGFGDASAALIGKSYGRNVIRHRLVEGPKTLEGTLSMFIVSAIVVGFCLTLYTALSWWMCVLVGIWVGLVSACIELVSRGGMDTITVPLAIASVLWMILQVGFVGVL